MQEKSFSFDFLRYRVNAADYAGALGVVRIQLKKALALYVRVSRLITYCSIQWQLFSTMELVNEFELNIWCVTQGFKFDWYYNWKVITKLLVWDYASRLIWVSESDFSSSRLTALARSSRFQRKPESFQGYHYCQVLPEEIEFAQIEGSFEQIPNIWIFCRSLKFLR